MLFWQNKNLSANILEPINNNGTQSKIDIEEVLEKTRKTRYFNFNKALNNFPDDSKGGFAQFIFNAAYFVILQLRDRKITIRHIMNISKTLFVPAQTH